jgi:DNA transformation protein and related proteins
VDAERLKELFEPFAAVSLKRMFSGHGVYAEGVCFALHLRGELYLKADSQTHAQFAAAGSEPFVYDGHRGRVTVTSYWRLPASAYDDPSDLKEWSALAHQAAVRFAAAKAAKAGKRMTMATGQKPAKSQNRGAKARTPPRTRKGRAK